VCSRCEARGKMKPCVYVLLFRGVSPLSFFIRRFTRGDFAHAGLVINGELWESVEGHGVRTRELMETDFENVVPFRLLGVDAVAVGKFLEFCEAHKDEPYDYWMVGGFVTRSKKERPESAEKWFCSEFVFAACLYAGYCLFRETLAWEVFPDLLKRATVLCRKTIQEFKSDLGLLAA